jgi:putative membrane-bound dehydrogenase-like protein
MKRILPGAALLALILIAWALPSGSCEDRKGGDAPRIVDRRLQVDLFAAAPDIVHPIAITFDRRGRLLVIESHTHFRPADYTGPKHDRIRVLEDTDGDGKADRFTTFFEGTRATMDIAVHPNGSVYLATRNEVLCLRDPDGTGKATSKQRIAFLDTKGDYPHNGLSGLAFDSRGDLYFGLGENIGAAYRLIGADGTTLTGGGEGGGVFHCSADGRHVRRVATGFWNPFGVGTDIFGRVFAVDNDPDAMPPCRLLHVVEGGDYGFLFRYGRSGRHPFQSWDGQLPGTLPMMSGTGEAPCEVLSYESDGLPEDYLGSLLVTSWADHRVERYEVRDRGASLAAQRKPFVQGGESCRPVGLALAPDGTLFVSDWVRSDYNLHGKGAVWHIRPRQAHPKDRPADPRRGLFSRHRPLREASARQLAISGRAFLRQQLSGDDLRVRAASLTALVDADDREIDLTAVADKDPSQPLRALAIRALARHGEDTGRFLGAKYPAELRREAIAGLEGKPALPRLLALLADADPFVRSAAVRQLSLQPDLLAGVELGTLKDARQRLGVLLAWRASGRQEGLRLLGSFLDDSDEDVRFLALKWVADHKLSSFAPRLTRMLRQGDLNVRLFFACSSALARLEDRDVSEASMAPYFFGRLTDEKSAPALRVLALQMLPATYPELTPSLLRRLLSHPERALRLEAVRLLSDQPGPDRQTLLLNIVRDTEQDDGVRAQAILGLAGQAAKHLPLLHQLAQGDNAVLRNEALRALKDTPVDAKERRHLEQSARRHPDSAALVDRVLGRPVASGRPPATDLDGWLKRLEGPADAAAGRRVFFQPRLAGCFRCHRVEGQGQLLGPDLSTIGRTDRRHILESILRPSSTVAPHFQVWHIETEDGKVRTGMLIRTELDEYTYLDTRGDTFRLNTRTIAESRPVPGSIMPDGLPDLLTDQEMRDLLAYLASRR